MLKDNLLNTFHQKALAALAALYDTREQVAILYWLYEDILNMSKADVVLERANKRLSESEIVRLQRALKALVKGQPIQQLLGYAYFGDIKIGVSAHTLIPRPETYELVAHIVSQEQGEAPLRILDIGTGSGCIPISLALVMPQHSYAAWDVSALALLQAQSNAKAHRLSIAYEEKDALLAQPSDYEGYDVVVSNPPYIPDNERFDMKVHVKNFEPEQALFVPANKALIFYENILQQAQKSTSVQRVYFEIHEHKKKEMAQLLEHFQIHSYQFFKDIHGRIRFMSIHLNA